MSAALSGTLIDLSINAFNHQDASNAMECMEMVNAQDLIVRDLGYAHKSALKAIDTQRQAAYVARLDPRINAYEKDKNGEYCKIDFAKLRSQMKRNNQPVVEKTVYLGADKSHKCRLIISLLPQEIEELRMRKIYRERKRNGSPEPSKELKARSQLTLMITNESSQRLPAENVYKLYMIRWQIELVFKAWKSICGLSAIKMVQGYRVDCYIHGKLILILLAWNIIWPMIGRIFKHDGKTISFFKAMKTVVSRVRRLADILIHKEQALRPYLRNLYYTISSVNMLEPKKGDAFYINIIANALIEDNSLKNNPLHRIA